MMHKVTLTAELSDIEVIWWDEVEVEGGDMAIRVCLRHGDETGLYVLPGWISHMVSAIVKEGVGKVLRRSLEAIEGGAAVVHRKRVNWEAVEWNRSSGDLARELGVTSQAVSKMRRKRAPGTLCVRAVLAGAVGG
jgi:hypothetical protein